MKRSIRRMNALAALTGARTYLEIGVERGVTFEGIEIESRVAVDPEFLVDLETLRGSGAEAYEITSDEYFEGLDVDRAFDIVFIDGLHIFEQAYRDLTNALLHTHANSLIVLDDTVPSDAYSAEREHRLAVDLRRGDLEVQVASWHGDVYKVVFAIHDFHPGLQYATITGPGKPQTFVWRAKEPRRKPFFDDLEAVSRLTYFDTQRHRELMHPTDEEGAMKLVADWWSTRESTVQKAQRLARRIPRLTA